MKLHHEKIEKNFGILCMEFKESDPMARDSYDHWHSKMEICRMLEGGCDFIINGKSYSAKAGDIIVIKSGEIHRFDPKGSGCKIHVCTFEPMFLYHQKIDISNLHHHITSDALKDFKIQGEIYRCFDILYKEGKADEKYRELIFKASLLYIYGLLLRNFEKSGELSKKEIAKLISFQKILEYISENCTENLSLKTLAKEFNYSYVYLSGMFKTRIGVNFKYYLDNIRISKAMELLLTTDMTIAEVSSASGFENIRTFNNVFKRINGFVPSEIKKEKS